VSVNRYDALYMCHITHAYASLFDAIAPLNSVRNLVQP